MAIPLLIIHGTLRGSPFTGTYCVGSLENQYAWRRCIEAAATDMILTLRSVHCSLLHGITNRTVCGRCPAAAVGIRDA